MVTSTSTPGSMLMEVICFTISEGECRSITRLWMRIWNLSQVLEPSPQGVLRVVMRRILVGMRTGPLTRSFCFLAPLMRSAHTFSRERTLREVRVILMRWMGEISAWGFSMSLPDTTAAAILLRYSGRDKQFRNKIAQR
ncbi:unnamed protein product [Chrysodeixis includens]|uniref:Uncharacterized protein n=1 Tax=Chrysodeixis includens TaxID=689277 RepID=A0A9N8L5B7_CHRIL|nr:unnamed protein product [Chrysodeixis includens]